MEKFGVGLLALGCATAIALWIYGVYCYVQMTRHRVNGASPFQIAWPSEQLTPRGREFRRRALHTYAWFAVLGLVLLIVTTIFGKR